MGQRFRLLIVGSAVVSAAGFFAWYVLVHKPSADTLTDTATECLDGTAQCFETPAELTGSPENAAELQDVVIGEGGIQLVPEP